MKILIFDLSNLPSGLVKYETQGVEMLIVCCVLNVTRREDDDRWDWNYGELVCSKRKQNKRRENLLKSHLVLLHGLVREQTISTERPPLVSEVSVNFC
jgi:hypothetical protein